MGLPYSKQINAAFDQVTPLVAAGFEVLDTTKNIAVLLAYIQVLTTLLLALILAALTALLITMNPDLEEERKVLVTPALKWILAQIQAYVSFFGQHRTATKTLLALFAIMIPIVYLSTHGRTGSDTKDADEQDESKTDKKDETAEQGPDIKKIKEGKAQQ